MEFIVSGADTTDLIVTLVQNALEYIIYQLAAMRTVQVVRLKPLVVDCQL